MIGEARSPAHFIVGGVRESSEDAMFGGPNQSLMMASAVQVTVIPPANVT